MSICNCTGACRIYGSCGGGPKQKWPSWFNKSYEPELPVIPGIDPQSPEMNKPIAICGVCGRHIHKVMMMTCNNPRCGVFPKVIFSETPKSKPKFKKPFWTTKTIKGISR